MGFFKGVGRAVKPLVNIPKWMSAKQLSSDAAYIADVAKKLATPPTAKHKETFEEALIRLKLSEADIQKRYHEFKRLALVFLTVFILLMGYMSYLLFNFLSGPVSWRALLLCFIVCLIAFIQVVRFHFWMYQIKKRRLGCSFKEYFFSGILGRKL